MIAAIPARCDRVRVLRLLKQGGFETRPYKPPDLCAVSIDRRPPSRHCNHDRETTVQLSNYLFFTTACEQALAFYTQCGLGRVVEMVRHGDNAMPVRNGLPLRRTNSLYMR